MFAKNTIRFWGSNSGPHVCKVNILPPVLYLQPLSLFFCYLHGSRFCLSHFSHCLGAHYQVKIDTQLLCQINCLYHQLLLVLPGCLSGLLTQSVLKVEALFLYLNISVLHFVRLGVPPALASHLSLSPHPDSYSSSIVTFGAINFSIRVPGPGPPLCSGNSTAHTSISTLPT